MGSASSSSSSNLIGFTIIDPSDIKYHRYKYDYSQYLYHISICALDDYQLSRLRTRIMALGNLELDGLVNKILSCLYHCLEAYHPDDLKQVYTYSFRNYGSPLLDIININGDLSKENIATGFVFELDLI